MSLFAHVSRATKEAFQSDLEPYGVHSGQHFLLEILWEKAEGLTVGEIATRLHVADAAISRTVRRMSREGLVEKHPHPTDARQVIIKLTEKGWSLQSVIPQLLEEREKQLLANISNEERLLFAQLLEQMLLNLETSGAPQV
jgi:DNA-binding MarR family transcriptional regulator